jgi:hypothetical protein
MIQVIDNLAYYNWRFGGSDYINRIDILIPISFQTLVSLVVAEYLFQADPLFNWGLYNQRTVSINIGGLEVSFVLCSEYKYSVGYYCIIRTERSSDLRCLYEFA